MGATLALCGLPFLAGADEATALSDGRALYQEHCEVCHGSKGVGDGPLAQDLRVVPADLTKIAARRGGTLPDAEIVATIDGRRRVRGHGSDMPVWGRVFAEKTPDPAERSAAVQQRISSLVAYLRSIQVQTAPK